MGLPADRAGAVNFALPSQGGCVFPDGIWPAAVHCRAQRPLSPACSNSIPITGATSGNHDLQMPWAPCMLVVYRAA